MNKFKNYYFKLQNKVFLFLTLIILLNGLLALSKSGNSLVGVADNGDGWRVSHAAGIYPIGSPNRFLVKQKFKLNERDINSSNSSAFLIAEISKTFNFFYKSDNVNEMYDIRQIGLCYFLLIIISFFLLLNQVPNWLLFLLSWIIFDSRYFLYFNSFYSFPFSFCLIFLILSLYIRFKLKKRLTERKEFIFEFFILLVVTLTTLISPQFILTPLVFLVLKSLSLFINRKEETNFHFKNAVIFIYLVISNVSIIYYLGDGNKFSHINQYDSIFMGPALVNNNNPEMYKRLGIPIEYSRFGQIGYMTSQTSEVVEISKDFRISSVSKFAIFKEYFHSMSIFLHTIDKIFKEFSSYHSENHGNFSIEVIPRDKPFISWWDFYQIRKMISNLINPILLFVVFFLHGCYLLYLLVLNKKEKILLLTIGFYAFTFGEILVALLGSGFFGIGRHLLPAAFSYDLCLIFTLAFLIDNKMKKFN